MPKPLLFRVSLLIVLSAFSRDAFSQTAGFVVERVTDDVVFNDDGTGEEQRSARIRIQSESAIREFGVLTFPYRNSFERIGTIEIVVTKPDGATIVTPESDARDVPAPVAIAAPAYSDSRMKQVPVKGLGVGDVLQWRSRTIRITADIPGHFSYAYNFFKDAVVLDETLTVNVPSAKTLKMSSPVITPTIRNEDDRVIYTWKTSQSDPPNAEQKTTGLRPAAQAAVQFTTFQSWDEVGRWYAALQNPKAAVTPAVQAKADELTKGFTTNLEKQRAIYQYVSTRFRYVSVSLGEGRYQPHSADEVLTNQYGDCKDKHTLFSALLKAAGIDAWTVLIADSIEFDETVPSPIQFNHVITYIPQAGSDAVWFDTTPEVAPYGMLLSTLRNKKALVIPQNGTASVMSTPDTLPFPADEIVDVKAKLSGDGTLTGHFDLSIRGDTEVVLKSAFYTAPPEQWNQLAQNVAMLMGYAGTVSNVAVDNPAGDGPFHYSYDYERKNYSDWANRRITIPTPPVGFEDLTEQPAEPITVGAKGTVVHRASLQVPAGFSLLTPGSAEFKSRFADYRSSYSFANGILVSERVLTRKMATIPATDWMEFRKFIQDVMRECKPVCRAYRSRCEQPRDTQQSGSGGGNSKSFPEHFQSPVRCGPTGPGASGTTQYRRARSLGNLGHVLSGAEARRPGD
jgi:transglutaminase-like putative cysteine protease